MPVAGGPVSDLDRWARWNVKMRCGTRATSRREAWLGRARLLIAECGRRSGRQVSRRGTCKSVRAGSGLQGRRDRASTTASGGGRQTYGAAPRAANGHQNLVNGRDESAGSEAISRREPTDTGAHDEPTPEPQTFTVVEAAHILRIGRTAAYALAREWCTTQVASAGARAESARSSSGTCPPARRARVRRRS